MAYLEILVYCAFGKFLAPLMLVGHTLNHPELSKRKEDPKGEDNEENASDNFKWKLNSFGIVQSPTRPSRIGRMDKRLGLGENTRFSVGV